MQLVKLLLSIFLPPLAVFLHRGVGGPLLINIILSLLGYVPGMVHAMFVVLSDPGKS